MDLKQLSSLLGIKTIQPLIKKMIDKRIVLSFEALNERFSPKTVLCYTLTETFSDGSLLATLLADLERKSTAKKQVDALLMLLNEGNYRGNQIQPILKKTLIDQGVSLSALQTLEKNGVIESVRIEVSRLKGFGQEVKEKKSLTQAQLCLLYTSDAADDPYRV
jgi:primosomal protein N' (replication factor Y)